MIPAFNPRLAVLGAKIKINDGCWEWTGLKTRDGYGTTKFNGKNQRLHRIMFTSLKSEIAHGLEIDHLCKNRACCNPDHLEAVTHAENLRRTDYKLRKDHHRSLTKCPRGHDYSGDNLYSDPRGGRQCRECRNIKQREWYNRNKHDKPWLKYRSKGVSQ